MSFNFKGIYTGLHLGCVTIPDYIIATAMIVLALYGLWWYTTPALKDSYFNIKTEYLGNLIHNGKHSKDIKLDNISEAINEMKLIYKSNVTRKLSNRVKQLRQLLRLIEDNTDKIYDALYKDFGRCEFLSYAYEIGPVVADIKLFIKV